MRRISRSETWKGDGVVEPLRLHAPSRRDAVVVALPVVLAPMAGITNAAYRALCLEQGAGLYVCEMLTSRGIIAGDHRTHSMLAFDPSETIRSVQLYGVDPKVMAHATRVLITDHGVHHVDLNFGCPVPKVTRKGGGGVLPYKRDRLRAIIRATVRAADEFGVPVTVKSRIGIDETHETFLDTGFIAEEEGVAAIALHARTAAPSASSAYCRSSVRLSVKSPTSSTVAVPKGPRAAETSGYQLPAMSRPSRSEVGEMTTGAPPMRAITHSPVDVEAGMGASLTLSRAAHRMRPTCPGPQPAPMPNERACCGRVTSQIRRRVTSSR